ncbi:MAG: stage V sporulation protein B [Peptococcaceae bacterium]|nr:stage V sporulation protein B [Peptococcaceae bacterium]
MAKKQLIYGTLILFAANLFSRILGFIYQYFVMKWVGAEAYGIYQMVFPTYIMALVLTTAGLPLAVSKLVSEHAARGEYASGRKIFRVALVLLLISGLVVSLALYIVIPSLTGKLFPDSRVVPVFLVCIPAIFIVAASSAFRGYFQGLQEMRPTALSQIFEQITRVSLGLGAAVKLLPYGMEYAAVGLALGMGGGELIGLLVTLVVYNKHKAKLRPDDAQTVPNAFAITKDLFRLGLPITGGRLVASASQAVDSMLIPLRLQAAGYSLRAATALYGQLNGAAITLLTFPTVFTFSLATSLVPAISEGIAKGQHRAVRFRVEEALRYTVLVGLPFLVFIYFYAAELSAIFNSPNAGSVLSTLCLAGIFFYLQSTTSGILQGMGYPQIPVFHLIIASILKLVVLYHLTSIPTLALQGTAIAYDFAFILTACLNIAAIAQKTGLDFDIQRLLLQPLSAAALMGLTLYVLKTSLVFTHGIMLVNFILSCAVYLLTLIINRGLNRSDLRRLPIINRFLVF